MIRLLEDEKIIEDLEKQIVKGFSMWEEEDRVIDTIEDDLCTNYGRLIDLLLSSKNNSCGTHRLVLTPQIAAVSLYFSLMQKNEADHHLLIHNAK